MSGYYLELGVVTLNRDLYENLKFEGRELIQVTPEEAAEKGLIKVGSAFGQAYALTLFMMAKYCKEKDLVKYYTVNVVLMNEKLEGYERLTFWRDPEGGEK
jgi:hypothetical protein